MLRSCGIRYLSTRRDIQKTLDAVKRLKINRTAQVGEIHRRWSEFEREQLNSGDLRDPGASRYSTESMLGEMMLSQEPSYQKILEKRAPPKVEAVKDRGDQGEAASFPLKSVSVGAEASKAQGSEAEAEGSTEGSSDRGFYVEADVFVDEYVAGSSLDLDPGDRMVATREYFGGDDAVEHISFQRPGQRAEGLQEGSGKDQDLSDDLSSEPGMIGTVDEEIPASSRKCTGCGANFHCKDSSLPGFVPLEILEKIDRRSVDQSLCKRCHLLQEHNFLLNVNVCDVDYTRMMGELKKQPESLVVLVVDVTDLPGSIYPRLASVVGSRRPMIVVGNKVDLLPPDARTGYMWRFKKTVERAVEKAGLLEKYAGFLVSV